MSEQNLHCPKVLGSTVDQGFLFQSHRVRSVFKAASMVYLPLLQVIGANLQADDDSWRNGSGELSTAAHSQITD